MTAASGGSSARIDGGDVSERSLHVGMLIHGMYPWDERVKREAQALVDAGHSVDVVCLKQYAGESSREIVDGVRVFRLPLRRSYRSGQSAYLFEYGGAFVGSMAYITALHVRHRYDVVQVHTLPDVLVFASALCKLGGSRIVIDIHDLMPELYCSKYGLSEQSRTVRLLRSAERSSTRFADLVITASEAFADRLVSSGLPGEKVEVILNTADPQVFPAPLEPRLPGPGDRFTVFWHGSMVKRYGLDLAIRGVALARESVPGIRFRVFGEGECEQEMHDLVCELGLEGVVEFGGQISHLEMAAHLAHADVGVVPNLPDVHIDMAYPTKLFEFVQMGVPVVATRTRILKRRFSDDSLYFVDPSPEAVAEGIASVYKDPAGARDAAKRARALIEPVSWERMKRIYVDSIRTVSEIRPRQRTSR